MILVDLNQVMISNLMVQIGGQKNIELDEGLFRHMILNSLRAARKKFNGSFGELVICCDDKNFWRRKRFTHYKANRKKYREQSDIDWSNLFNILNKVLLNSYKSIGLVNCIFLFPLDENFTEKVFSKYNNIIVIGVTIIPRSLLSLNHS